MDLSILIEVHLIVNQLLNGHVFCQVQSLDFSILQINSRKIMTQIGFKENLMLYILIKNFQQMKIMEFIWLYRMVYRLCAKVVFPLKNFLWRKFCSSRKDFELVHMCSLHQLCTCLPHALLNFKYLQECMTCLLLL